MKRKKNSSKTEEVNELIISYLLEGPKPLGPINKYLLENGIKYSKKGLILRLHQLGKDGKIGKKMVSNHIHPVYYIIGSELKDQYAVAYGGSSFEIESGSFIFEIPKFEKYSKKLIDSMIKRLVTRIGLYVIYSHLHSCKLTSKSQSLNHNRALRKKWLYSTLHWPIENDRYIEFLLDFMEPETYKSTKLLYQDEKQIKKLFKLEQSLGELFPKEMSSLDSIMSKISEDSRTTRILSN